MAILTDLDASGLLISKKASSIPRVGIDFQTLEALQIDREDVEEDYDPGDHYKKLTSIAEHEDDDEQKSLLFEIRKRRIEIDTVIAAAGSERFWKYLKTQLEYLFTNRDYNRAIEVPNYVMPEEIEDLVAKLENKGIAVAENERNKIIDELKDIEGFYDNISEKEEQISQRIKKTISDDGEIKSLLPEIAKLKEKYDYLK